MNAAMCRSDELSSIVLHSALRKAGIRLCYRFKLFKYRYTLDLLFLIHLFFDQT